MASHHIKLPPFTARNWASAHPPDWGAAVTHSWDSLCLLFGWLAGRLGTKPSFTWPAVYTLISIGGYFVTTALHFWVLALLVGTVQGGTQALSRSLFGAMSPRVKSAEFFGFYGMSSRFAGIAGPLLFALIGQIPGSSRLSIVSLIVFFILGSLILSRVDEQEGILVARAEDAGLVA